MATLEDILNDEPTQNETIEAQEPEGQPRDESGRFAAKGESQDTVEGVSPAPVAKQDSELDHPALIGERRRRQEAEARIAEYERKEAERANPPEPIPSVFEDEQGFQQRFGQEVVSAAVQQANFANRLSTSEFYARKNIDGFTKEWENLNAWLTDNPAVAQQTVNELDPWGSAWDQYRKQQTIQELGATSIDELKAKLREELRAEMQSQAPAPLNIPDSLASTQSSRSGTVQPSRPSIEYILGQ